MTINKKEENTFNAKPRKPILNFWYNEMLNGIRKEMFPLVIREIVASFGVSRILIYEGCSYDIMFT